MPPNSPESLAAARPRPTSSKGHFRRSGRESGLFRSLARPRGRRLTDRQARLCPQSPLPTTHASKLAREPGGGSPSTDFVQGSLSAFGAREWAAEAPGGRGSSLGWLWVKSALVSAHREALSGAAALRRDELDRPPRTNVPLSDDMRSPAAAVRLAAAH